MPTTAELAPFLAALLDRQRSTLRTTMPQTLLVRARPTTQQWHRIEQHHVILVLRDRITVRHPGGTLHLGPGDAAWLPAGQPYALDQSRPRTQFRLRFRLEITGKVPPLPGGPFTRSNAWHLRPLFELAHCAWSTTDDDDAIRLRCLLGLLLSYLASTSSAPVVREPGTLSPAQRIAVAERVAGWATMGMPTPNELAQAAGLGADWFGRAFVRTYGLPPRLWLARQRFDFATTLLISSADPIERIARRLGFAQTAQFNRQFRQRYGSSPARWRSEHLA